MNEQNDNQENFACCCQPMTEESEEFKKIKPMLITGLFIYIGLLFLDIFYLRDNNLFDYLFLIICIYCLIFNKCFMIFPIYTLFSMYLVLGTSLPGLGIIVQTKFKKPKTTEAIIIFFIYFFIIFFSCFIFYISFNAYKEIRYLFEMKIANNPNLIPSYMATNTTQSNNNYYGSNNNYNSNYNNNNYNNGNYNNNNNNNQNKGFKAFSGKGYTVGGS